MKTQVLILMGSDSDLPIMEAASKMLDDFKISYHMTVSSAHRTPDRTVKLIRDAEKGGVQVIIAGAGAAAHLAGVVAAHTTLPVIGIPIDSSPLRGVDALYSTVQMPPGIPVATIFLNDSKLKDDLTLTGLLKCILIRLNILLMLRINIAKYA